MCQQCKPLAKIEFALDSTIEFYYNATNERRRIHMNYDKIIIELMGRIQVLEEKVADLQSIVEAWEDFPEKDKPKTTTGDIRKHILDKITAAEMSGEESITLRASDIHRELKLKSRFPMVCNAMRQCMKESDEILFETASGYSSSLEIRYCCK